MSATAGGEPKRIAVTLDDGYRDNLEHAWPVFQKHRAPFTIFVCPGFTERKSELWWEALARMIGAASSFEAPGEEPAEMRLDPHAGRKAANVSASGARG